MSTSDMGTLERSQLVERIIADIVDVAGGRGPLTAAQRADVERVAHGLAVELVRRLDVTVATVLAGGGTIELRTWMRVCTCPTPDLAGVLDDPPTGRDYCKRCGGWRTVEPGDVARGT